MYINKPSLTKIEFVNRVNSLYSSSHKFNLENPARCLYPCPDKRHFMIVTKKVLLSEIEIKH